MEPSTGQMQRDKQNTFYESNITFPQVKSQVNTEVTVGENKNLLETSDLPRSERFYLTPTTVCVTVYLTPPPTSSLASCQNKQGSTQQKLCCQDGKRGKSAFPHYSVFHSEPKAKAQVAQGVRLSITHCGAGDANTEGFSSERKKMCLNNVSYV